MKYYNFGPLKVIVSGADAYFKKIAAAYEAEPFAEYDIKFNIEKSEEIILPSCEKIGEMPYNLANLSWYRDGDGYYMAGFNAPTEEYVFCGHISGDFKDVDIDILDIKGNADDSLYIKNVVDLFFRFVNIRHNCINIHSSSIAYNGMGVLFSAPSGTGKSTHTGLWQKHYPGTVIINDDLPLISVGDDVKICGTCWCGTSGVNTNVTVPLAAVVFLRRGAENKITRLGAVQSLRYLIDEIFKSPVPEIAEKQFDLIGGILQKVPAYLLECNISAEAVETVKEVLEGKE